MSAIGITNFANGQDADTAPGVSAPIGHSVAVTFVLTNPGNVAVRDVEVVETS